jgi:hypothetical protein
MINKISSYFKGKFVPELNCNIMKMYVGMEVMLHEFLTSTLNGSYHHTLSNLPTTKENPHVTLYVTTNSVALVLKRTISTERPPLVGEVSAAMGIRCADHATPSIRKSLYYHSACKM